VEKVFVTGGGALDDLDMVGKEIDDDREGEK
jgi:hypothetical protein